MKISRNDYWLLEQYNGVYDVDDYGILYYLNGNLHREDGPAAEYISGIKYWYINGKIHNLNGPACEWYDNIKFYYIEGKQYDTKEEFEAATYMYLNGLQDYL